MINQSVGLNEPVFQKELDKTLLQINSLAKEFCEIDCNINERITKGEMAIKANQIKFKTIFEYPEYIDKELEENKVNSVFTTKKEQVFNTISSVPIFSILVEQYNYISDYVNHQIKFLNAFDLLLTAILQVSKEENDITIRKEKTYYLILNFLNMNLESINMLLKMEWYSIIENNWSDIDTLKKLSCEKKPYEKILGKLSYNHKFNNLASEYNIKWLQTIFKELNEERNSYDWKNKSEEFSQAELLTVIEYNKSILTNSISKLNTTSLHLLEVNNQLSISYNQSESNLFLQLLNNILKDQLCNLYEFREFIKLHFFILEKTQDMILNTNIVKNFIALKRLY